MTQKPRVNRRYDSTVGLIVWHNMLQIRQDRIDEYWWTRWKEKARTTKTVIKPLKNMNATERKSFLQSVTPLVKEELGPLSYYPEPGNPLPAAKQFKEQFAADTGIDDTRFNELQARHQLPNVEELVAIARLGSVDISYMFLPTMEVLENDSLLSFGPIGGMQQPIATHRWVLWIRGLMHLPGQFGKKYLIELSLPAKKYATVDGRPSREVAQIQADIRQRATSNVSALDALVDQIPNQSITLNLTDLSAIDPFNTGRNTAGYHAKRGERITKEVNSLGAHQRKLLSMATNKISGRTRLRARFNDGFVAIHGVIVKLMVLIQLARS